VVLLLLSTPLSSDRTALLVLVVVVVVLLLSTPLSLRPTAPLHPLFGTRLQRCRSDQSLVCLHARIPPARELLQLMHHVQRQPADAVGQVALVAQHSALTPDPALLAQALKLKLQLPQGVGLQCMGKGHAHALTAVSLWARGRRMDWACSVWSRGRRMH